VTAGCRTEKQPKLVFISPRDKTYKEQYRWAIHLYKLTNVKLRGSENARLILVSKLFGAFFNLITAGFQD
jgi:hypothetical protein